MSSQISHAHPTTTRRVNLIYLKFKAYSKISSPPHYVVDLYLNAPNVFPFFPFSLHVYFRFADSQTQTANFSNPNWLIVQFLSKHHHRPGTTLAGEEQRNGWQTVIRRKHNKPGICTAGSCSRRRRRRRRLRQPPNRTLFIKFRANIQLLATHERTPSISV